MRTPTAHLVRLAFNPLLFRLHETSTHSSLQVSHLLFYHLHHGLLRIPGLVRKVPPLVYVSTFSIRSNAPYMYTAVVSMVSHARKFGDSPPGITTICVNGSGSRGLRVGGVKDNGGECSEEIHWWVS